MNNRLGQSQQTLQDHQYKPTSIQKRSTEWPLAIPRSKSLKTQVPVMRLWEATAAQKSSFVLLLSSEDRRRPSLFILQSAGLPDSTRSHQCLWRQASVFCSRLRGRSWNKKELPKWYERRAAAVSHYQWIPSRASFERAACIESQE